MTIDPEPVTRDWLHRFAKATRIATLDMLEMTNTCILTTRVGIAVLARYGIPARPQPVFVGVYNVEGWKLTEQRVPIEDWPATAHSVGVSEHSQATNMSGWDGHLVLIVKLPGEPRTLIDLTADQFDRPERGMHVGGPVFMNITPGAPWTPHDPLFTPLGDRSNPSAIMGYRPMPPGHANATRWRTTPDWTCPDEIIDSLVDHISSVLNE